jgi:putative transposase
MNRGARRGRLFETDGDYRAFLTAAREAITRHPVALYSYCLMPNHFHLVCAPTADAQLSSFVGLTTLLHSKRWHAFRKTAGTGCVYQGRFRAFPVQDDTHFLTVCRYVERNPLRARLVSDAVGWRWSSLGARCRNCNDLPLKTWPILQPPNWIELVNSTEGRGEASVRQALRRGQPFGDESWAKSMAGRLGLEHTLRPTGRPVERDKNKK